MNTNKTNNKTKLDKVKLATLTTVGALTLSTVVPLATPLAFADEVDDDDFYNENDGHYDNETEIEDGGVQGDGDDEVIDLGGDDYEDVSQPEVEDTPKVPEVNEPKADEPKPETKPKPEKPKEQPKQPKQDKPLEVEVNNPKDVKAEENDVDDDDFYNENDGHYDNETEIEDGGVQGDGDDEVIDLGGGNKNKENQSVEEGKGNTGKNNNNAKPKTKTPETKEGNKQTKDSGNTNTGNNSKVNQTTPQNKAQGNTQNKSQNNVNNGTNKGYNSKVNNGVVGAEGNYNNSNNNTNAQGNVNNEAQNGGVVVEQGVNSVIHAVKYGDTLSQLALQYGTTVEQIAKDNNIANVNLIFVGQKLVINANTNVNSQNYTIQRGDTLSQIAQKFGTTVEKLAKDNNIQNVDLIFAGHTIVVK